MERENSNLAVIDLAKLIMAFMVVGIHMLGNYGIYPLFRIAVPLFFMISSYLFFIKDNGSTERLKKFCLRNFKLYAFWFIVLSPIFLKQGKYLEGDLAHNFFSLFMKIIFGSSFPASWFISALIIGVIIIFYARKYKIRDEVILAITGSIYIICCLNSNYHNLFSENSMILQMNRWYPATLYNGFPAGLFWIALGSYLARKDVFRKKKAISGLIISAAFLMAEYGIIQKYHLAEANDCYVMMIPVCCFLFELLLHCKIKGNTKILRKISTIVYCVHLTIANNIGGMIMNRISDPFLFRITLYMSVVLLSTFIAAAICFLETKKPFTWLKYAY